MIYFIIRLIININKINDLSFYILIDLQHRWKIIKIKVRIFNKIFEKLEFNKKELEKFKCKLKKKNTFMNMLLQPRSI